MALRIHRPFNPAMYAHPEAFENIVEDSNKNAETAGLAQ